MAKAEKPVVLSVSKIFNNIHKNKKENEQLIKSLDVEFLDIERFEVIQPIGQGKFSLVFKGRMDGKKLCAIKALKNITFERIQKELYLLQQIKDIPNCINLCGCVKDPLTKTISIITNYYKSLKTDELYQILDNDEIKVFMYKILKALYKTHKKGIMHRDIKPGNIIFSKNKKNVTIIDWGLADFYYSENCYTTRVSTLRYKAPELLLDYGFYDYGIDIWGAGVVLAEIYIKYPFFDGKTLGEMISRIASVCGTTSVNNYCQKFKRNKPEGADFSGLYPQPQWEKYGQDYFKYKAKYDPQCIDLLQKLLCVDHQERITAEEALNHSFFDSIRDTIE